MRKNGIPQRRVGQAGEHCRLSCGDNLPSLRSNHRKAEDPIFTGAGQGF